MTLLTVTEYLCHKWPPICSVCRNHTTVLSAFMTCHRVCNKSNTTGYLQRKFEDTKGVIRSRKSKDKQNNGQRKRTKWTSNDLQNITQKTKDRSTRTPLKTGDELGCPEEFLLHLWYRYVPFVVIIIRSFPHSWLVTGSVTRVTRRVPQVEQELFRTPEFIPR
jgi:hypothetical protein